MNIEEGLVREEVLYREEVFGEGSLFFKNIVINIVNIVFVI